MKTRWGVCFVLTVSVLLMLAGPSMAAMAGDGHGAESAGGYSSGASHSVAAYKGEAVKLVNMAAVQELDHARNRDIATKDVKLSAEEGSSTMFMSLGLLLVALVIAGVFTAKSKFYEDLRLSFKLGSGFSVVLALALAIGAGGYYFLDMVNFEHETALAATKVDMLANEAGMLDAQFILFGKQSAEKAEVIWGSRGMYTAP